MKNHWSKHDLSHSRVYRIWIGMRARCYNSHAVPYPYYGAKGITVCGEWKNDFMSFYKWSMSHGYSDDLTLDRIDSRGNYEPENCRWADKYTQNANTQKKLPSSGYYGISRHTNHDSWYGRVKVYGKCICTGSAPTAREAAILRERYIIDHGLVNVKNGVLNEPV